MTLYELSNDQIIELSQCLLCRLYDEMLGESPSYGELANAEDIITPGLLVAFYDGTIFTDDDFCTDQW